MKRTRIATNTKANWVKVFSTDSFPPPNNKLSGSSAVNFTQLFNKGNVSVEKITYRNMAS